MVTPESRVKSSLVRRIRALGGEVRFVKWIGRNNAPDTLVLLEGISPTFVETKAPGETPRPAQEREFERLRHFGFRVLIISNPEELNDEFPL